MNKKILHWIPIVGIYFYWKDCINGISILFIYGFLHGAYTGICLGIIFSLLSHLR